MPPSTSVLLDSRQKPACRAVSVRLQGLGDRRNVFVVRKEKKHESPICGFDLCHGYFHTIINRICQCGLPRHELAWTAETRRRMNFIGKNKPEGRSQRGAGA